MITSTANQKIKRLVNFQKKRKLRDAEGVFLVEGVRMFREVPAEDLLEVYVSESFYRKEKELVDKICQGSNLRAEILTDAVFAHVSDTQTPQGVLCVVTQKGKSGQVSDLWNVSPRSSRNHPGENPKKSWQAPFLMILDNLQDPGNMGTILRTAEAAGVTGIVMSKDCVDVYNPKVIRSTMGSIFRMPFLYVEDLAEAVKEIKAAGIRTYAAHLAGRLAYDEPDYKKPSAFMIGNEGNGLRGEIADLADTYIIIPMAGQVESLNAAVAATVLMFETSRQRR